MNNEQLVQIVTKIVLEILNSSHPVPTTTPRSGNNKEVFIGVGPAYGEGAAKTINGLDHIVVLNEIKAGIEEEGMDAVVVKVFKSSDVAVLGKEAADMAGSGFGIGLQSKGTAIIHQRNLQILSNIELFPQAPLLTLNHYRAIGKNAAKYAKNLSVTPITVENDPMIRAKYQVKAALMHHKETEKVDRNKKTIVWCP